MLQESQAHGQLVREWQVALGFETETAPLKWHRVAAGLSIGHKRTVAVPTHWQSEYKLTHIKLTVLGVAEQESGPGEGEAELTQGDLAFYDGSKPAGPSNPGTENAAFLVTLVRKKGDW